MNTKEERAEYKREWKRRNPDKVKASRLREKAKINADRPSGPRICAYRHCDKEIVGRTWRAEYCSIEHEAKERYLRNQEKGYYKERRNKNIEKVREYDRKYRSSPERRAKRKAYDNDPKRVKERRSQHLMRRYGVTIEEYDALLETQNGVCAICGGPLTRASGKLPHLDHSHNSKKIRGLLCAGCNHGLGYLEKSGWTEKAQAYLTRTAVA